MTGELFGTRWKIKMDSYLPGSAIVDLKIMASITDLKWVRDLGYLDFVRYWGYDIQGAVYQKIVEQNTGKKIPFFIAAATKEKEPDIRVIKGGGPVAESLSVLCSGNLEAKSCPKSIRLKHRINASFAIVAGTVGY